MRRVRASSGRRVAAVAVDVMAAADTAAGVMVASEEAIRYRCCLQTGAVESVVSVDLRLLPI
jgi:hypothetical protein